VCNIAVMPNCPSRRVGSSPKADKVAQTVSKNSVRSALPGLRPTRQGGQGRLGQTRQRSAGPIRLVPRGLRWRLTACLRPANFVISSPNALIASPAEPRGAASLATVPRRSVTAATAGHGNCACRAMHGDRPDGTAFTFITAPGISRWIPRFWEHEMGV
jgi:hypothetical protein